MFRKTALVATAAAGLFVIAPTGASAHVSMHPNAIPAGSFPTINFRVPNEEDKASTTSVRIQMPDGVLSASGAPPAGWKFSEKTKQLDKPIKTDDGTITSTVTEVDFTGGKIGPGEFQNFPLTLSIPDSAKAGDVLSFKTLQGYSSGETVRWIENGAEAEHPAPTIDITKAGTALLDVTGGDAGPPAKLPTDLAGASSTSSSASTTSTNAPTSATRTVVEKKTESKGLSIAALIIGLLGLAAGGAALAGRRSKSAA